MQLNNAFKLLSLFVISLLVLLLVQVFGKSDSIYQINAQKRPLALEVANLSPNLPNFSDLVRQTLYVNNQHPQALDTNPGTVSLPLKTIGKAAEIAQINKKNNIGTKIVIYSGTYRESISLKQEGQKTNAPIIFAAKEIGNVIISGADIWQGWQRYQKTGIYTHPWPYKWGLSGNPWTKWNVDFRPILQRQEMVFVKGKLLKQVLSLAEVTEGTFYVSEAESSLYIYPPSGTDIANDTIEVANRRNVFDVIGSKNIALIGITFKHCACGVFDASLNIIKSTNILVDKSQFIWNNWLGLSISNSQNVIIRMSQANHNGEAGMKGYRVKNLLLEDTENSYNNWRGAWGEFYGWDAGQKFLFLHNGTFRRYKAVGNQSAGLWLDTDIENVLIEDAEICENAHHALYIEAVQGPLAVKNSVICNNHEISKNKDDTWYNPGIFTASSSNITLENNIICNNERSQIRVMTQEQRDVENFETGKTTTLKMENWTLKNNLIVGNSPTQLVIETPGWNHFLNSLTSAGNTWYNLKNGKVFKVDDRELAFKDWQSLTKQDLNSVFAAPKSLPKYCTSAT